MAIGRREYYDGRLAITMSDRAGFATRRYRASISHLAEWDPPTALSLSGVRNFPLRNYRQLGPPATTNTHRLQNEIYPALLKIGPHARNSQLSSV